MVRQFLLDCYVCLHAPWVVYITRVDQSRADLHWLCSDCCHPKNSSKSSLCCQDQSDDYYDDYDTDDYYYDDDDDVYDDLYDDDYDDYDDDDDDDDDDVTDRRPNSVLTDTAFGKLNDGHVEDMPEEHRSDADDGDNDDDDNDDGGGDGDDEDDNQQFINDDKVIAGWQLQNLQHQTISICKYAPGSYFDILNVFGGSKEMSLSRPATPRINLWM